MKLMKQITDFDILNEGKAALIKDVSRYGSRGIVIDNRCNIALLHMTTQQLYKLPGGGMDEGEHPKDAFLREIEEELGCKSTIICELGYIEEHKNMNHFMQRSYCYIAKSMGVCNEPRFTEQEQALGLSVQWMTQDRALEMMHASVLLSKEYSAKFMTYRDQLILEESITFLKDLN